jgi:hypothetical protein
MICTCNKIVTSTIEEALSMNLKGRDINSQIKKFLPKGIG